MADNELNGQDETQVSEESVSEETAASTEAKDTVADTQAKTVSSNWKKVIQARKDAEKKAKALESELVEARKALEEAKKVSPTAKPVEEPEAEESDAEELPYDDVKLQFYVLKNGHTAIESEIRAALEKFPGISFEDATDFAKSKQPKTSRSKTDFALQGSVKPKTGGLTEEEAADKLSSTDYLTYLREKGDPMVTGVRHVKLR